MKTLIIGGNRFVGLRLALLLDKDKNFDLHILNRTGQAAHVKNAAIFKGTRDHLAGAHIDRDWDLVVDFAGFNYMQAKGAIEHFKRVGLYVFISTVSVYDDGRSHAEADFDPTQWMQHETPEAREKENLYQFGKRQAEAAFAQEAPFPFQLVRFPFILGLDDYTHRLEFHVERIEQGKPIYLPNPKAHVSLISSEDAAAYLHWTATRRLTGPINVASPDDITLESLIAQIERRVGRKAQRVEQAITEAHSPYGVSEDMSVNVKKMKDAGFAIRPLANWLPDLIDSLASSDGSHLH